MSLSEKLAAVPPREPHRFRRSEHPSGFEWEWDGSKGFIQTGPLAERPRTWDQFIRDAGLDPDEVEVVEPVQVRGWDASAGGGDVVRMHYYRLTVRRRRPSLDLDELVREARRRSRRKAEPPTGDLAYAVVLGDLQLGKADGDGVAGTVDRFYASTERAVRRLREVRKQHAIGPVYLIHLGDCIEGFVSQGGANAWRTSLTLTEQVRLYRRLLLDQVKAFASLTEKLVIVGIPGNHDEANRPLHTYGDSWAIEAVAQVRDALELAGGYEHVTCVAPERDELTVTLDVCGTVVGMAHGHQFGSAQDGYKKWWAGQAMGRQPIGDADVLLAGHFHHLKVVRESRTFIQVPSLESESTWYRHRTGAVSAPGIVTMVLGGGGWSSLEVL